jgi:ribonuclease P protein component
VAGLGFSKGARLLRRAEFVAAKEKGRSFAFGPLAASWRLRALGQGEGMPVAGARVGLTVSSKVGGAVVRNRVKRRLREAVRHELAGLPPVDLVVVARPSAVDAGVPEFRSWLRKAAERIGKERAG